MFETLLTEQNPHWAGELYPDSVKRTCFTKLLEYLPLQHIISVTGVRRAGKSTLLKQLINFLIQDQKVNPGNILFLNLEHPYFTQYSQDVAYLEKVFEEYLRLTSPKGKIFCLLDEIQFFSNWPVFVKAHYEQKGVKFIITGSNSHLMSEELLTLLSGRTLPLEVYPLSFIELVQARLGIHEFTSLNIARHRRSIQQILNDFILYGGFPEVALEERRATVGYDILNAYSRTILYQDVASRLNPKKPVDLERLYYYLASHIGAPFTYANLSKVFDLTDKTIKEYIQGLMDAQLLFEVERFSFALKHQVRGSKKIYSIDTGMVNAIAFQFSDNRGRLFENILFLELKRLDAEIYYFKTRQDYEVDFIVKRGKQLSLIQVCVELNHDATLSREVRALVHAAQELNEQEGIIVTADDEREIIISGVTIRAIPLYKFILAIQVQAAKGKK